MLENAKKSQKINYESTDSAVFLMKKCPEIDFSIQGIMVEPVDQNLSKSEF